MAQAHVDPEALREFSGILAEFARETREQLGRVSGLLKEMGTTVWRDERHTEFCEQFEEVERLIAGAADSIENEQVPRLHELAQQAEEYLGA